MNRAIGISSAGCWVGKAVLLTVVVMFGQSCTQERSHDPPFGLAIHGGAGTILRQNMTSDLEKEYNVKLTEVLYEGYSILKNGGSSLNAVEAAIRSMENSPLFNAGKGAVFTNSGTNELDASIMDGKTLKAGAVAAVKHIKNPISLARLIMEKSPHVLMVGDGAEVFAKEHGVEWVPQDYFYTERRWKQLQRIKNKEKKNHGISRDLYTPELRLIAGDSWVGTVGAVALDKGGNLAAGTSTGGMTNKKFGRVGDSPIIGAGTYANNNSCAVSCTGHGEYFIRSVVAYDISILMTYQGMSLQEAANTVVKKKLVDLGGSGGVIAIDKAGNVAMPFNTEGMFRGYVGGDGRVIIKIFKD